MLRQAKVYILIRTFINNVNLSSVKNNSNSTVAVMMNCLTFFIQINYRPSSPRALYDSYKAVQRFSKANQGQLKSLKVSKKEAIAKVKQIYNKVNIKSHIIHIIE